MKRTIFTIVFFGLLTIMLACEGIVGGDGYIYNSKTNIPLAEVKVVLLLNNKAQDSCYSNEKGFFRASQFVGCVPKCPNAKILLTKDGFKSLAIDFDEYWKSNDYNSISRDSLILYLIPNE
ncbi:hypothetical protein EZ428_00415 [Pedobacter frigiditerrae]|uniref:Lipoprotein n=1 Tax=Pedobacter frigiditerrae TaxID=2530452 RepID=A0A4R0N0N6_9SPHI|nr:hypothetical protein [Pedobacter frigiditerrae]TCC93271.1 hypothetical protein EZ428_00415 [Pedobacter frigiditerrae]